MSINANESPNLTIREEQVVQALLLEQFSLHKPSTNQPDDQIEFIIQNVNLKNRHLAENKLLLNRGAINIQQQDFNIDTIIQQVQQLSHVEIQQKVQALQQKQGFMEEFDINETAKLKVTEEEFFEFESKYPKVKECLGQKIQYSCVRIESSRVERWFAHNQKDISKIFNSLLFMRQDVEYRMYVLEQKVYCFTSKDNYCEPFVLMPTRTKFIRCLSISMCKKYLLVGLVDEIIVYQINSTKSITLIKNISDLKVKEITNLGFCGNGFERVYIVDSQKEILLVTIQNTFIFYRVDINRIDICLNKIVNADFLKLVIDDDEFYILAFSSNTEIAIYLIFPFVQLLHIENFQDDLAISKTKSNSRGNSVDQHCVNIKWRCNQPSTIYINTYTNVKPQLIISFWNKIIILKMIEANNDVVPFTAKFIRFLYFTNHYPILNVGLISFNHLMIQSTNNTLIVAIPLITSSSIDEECEESSIIYVNSQCYSRLFPSNSCANKLIVSLPTKIEIFEVIKLQDYIDKELSQKSDYMNIFSLLLLISKGLNYSFVCDYDEDELTKIIYYCVQNLLVSLSKVKTDENTLAIRLYWVCELLIESSRQHFIWSLVYLTVKNTLRKSSVLFICLESFFFKGMIHVVPPDIFDLIIENYLERNRSKLLLKSIMNLNLEEHNIEKYLEQIIEKEMYSLFIYLFQNLNDEGDYLTPFVKLFARWRKSVDQEKKEYLGKLCLWYLYKSIKGIKFPEVVMSWEQRQLCFQSLLIQPLNPIFSKPFLEFNQQLYLTLYLYICTNDQIIRYVNKNHSTFIQKLSSFEQTVDPDQNIFKQIVLFIKKTYKRQSTAFYQFVSLVSLKNPIDLQLLYQTCLYYLSHPNLISQECLIIINPIQKDSGKILLQMLFKLKILLKSNKLYLKKLMAHKSYHWEVVSYLHSLDGKYKVAIQSLLDSEKRDNIFILIKQIINQFQFQSQQNSVLLKQIQSIIQFEVGRLIKINPQETLFLLKKLKVNIQNILKNLKLFPQLKLQLITSIILDNQKQNIQQNSSFLIDHLELVCEYDKFNLMKYLKHINYPLDDCAKICQRYNQFQGKAFIQNRSGDILGALRSYQKAIIYKLKDHRNLIPNILKPMLMKYFTSAMNLCKNNPCSSVTPVQQNNWLCLMEIIVDIQDHKHSQKVDIMIELNNYFNLVYGQLFNHVPAKILLEYFLNGNRKFLPRILLKSWYSLSILFKFEYSMYNMAIETNVIDTTGIMTKYSQWKWKGIFSDSTQCCFCDGPLVEEKQLVFFSCQHFFHKVCHKNKLCLACKFQSDSLFIKSILHQMMSKRKQSQFWVSKKEVPVVSHQNGVIYIELQNPEEKRKKLRQKLKSFQYQKIKNDNELDESFDYYFKKKQCFNEVTNKEST